jgi:quercetin dioxygenase-like cupin family protein
VKPNVIHPEERTMQIVSQRDELHEPDSANPIFIGHVRKQILASGGLWVNSVSFPSGARNKWHTHSTQQVLFVTSGRGIIATNDGETEITTGDTVTIEPGERHWHGAAPGEDMTHLSILLPGEVSIEDESAG